MTIPASWTRVPVTGIYSNLDGTIPAGPVYFISYQVVKIAGAVIMPGSQAVVLVNGSIPAGFSLPATNDPGLDLKTWDYQVIEAFPGGRAPFWIAVPYTATSIDMASVVPVTRP